MGWVNYPGDCCRRGSAPTLRTLRLTCPDIKELVQPGSPWWNLGEQLADDYSLRENAQQECIRQLNQLDLKLRCLPLRSNEASYAGLQNPPNRKEGPNQTKDLCSGQENKDWTPLFARALEPTPPTGKKSTDDRRRVRGAPSWKTP